MVRQWPWQTSASAAWRGSGQEEAKQQRKVSGTGFVVASVVNVVLQSL